MDEVDFKKKEIITSSNELSKRQVWFFGSIFIFAGLMIILLATGITYTDPSANHAPIWIIISAGLVFLFGGISVINSYALSSPNLIISNILGMSIVGAMTVIYGWIAFGPGERHFSSTSSFLFSKTTTSANPEQGRFVFGFAFFLMLIFFTYGTVSSFKK